MSETADRYRERAVAFTEKVEGVPDDRWEAQSPCEDWTARDVVRHMVSVSGMFLGFVGQDPPPAPSVDDDPKTAWSVTRDALQAALEDPKVAQQEYDGMFGKTTFEKSVGQFVCADLVVHNWDLSRATGQDDSLD